MKSLVGLGWLALAVTACGPSVGTDGPGTASSNSAADGERRSNESPAAPGDPDAPAGTGRQGVRAPVKTEPQLLSQTEGLYPRAIRRSNGTIVATAIRNLGPRMGAGIFESTDEGLSFKEIGTIDDPINNGGLCCGTIYELSKPLGAMPSGTLLWSASVGGDSQNQPMSVPVWKSDDGGRTWTFVSKVVVGRVPRRDGGLWEPELSQLDDGTVVCHWSDETSGAHSQKLVEARTSDGVTWRDHRDTVALGPYAHRPGMPNVRRPAGGPYVMTYEICGINGDHCAAWFRTSDDGWNWGDAGWNGFRPTMMNGKHFRHAPTLALGSGRLLMVGQMVHQRNGAVAPENGRILLANVDGGFRSWFPIQAPVPVPDAFDNYCPNYSSTLLPLDDGKVVLEIASRREPSGCRAYFARGPVVDTSDGSEFADETNVRLVNLLSSHCLDVANGSTSPGANVQQWTCNGSPAQKWTITRSGGSMSLRAAGSNMCLTVAGGSSTPAANVEQQPCGGAGQSWKLRGVGIDHFELVMDNSSVCLDVASGSTASGANVAQWTCNGLSPQIWRLERL